MPQRIDVAGVGILEFPDGMPDDQISAAIQKNLPTLRQDAALKEAQQQQMGEMSGMDKFVAAAGNAPIDLYRGLKQIVANTPASQGAAQRDVNESRKLNAPLLATGEGKAGNIVGNVATILPAAFIPGANTVTGAGLVGAVGGALTPTAGNESRLLNTAIGGVGGAGTQKVLGAAANALTNRLAAKEAEGAALQAQNAGKDAVLQTSREAGYVVPPSMVEGAPLTSRVMEGVSGKAKTAQAFSVQNQNLTQKLANKALGIAEDAPLNLDTTKALRAAVYEKGYAPIDTLPQIPTDKAYLTALDGIAANRQGAARSFPGMANDAPTAFLDTLKVDSFFPKDARQATQILRDEAGAAFAQGNKEMGKAKLKAAVAIEDQIERGLQGMGKDGAALLDEFRNARTLIAKSFDVDKALISGKGKVNAEVFAAALRKGKPLSGDLKTIGEFANTFGEVSKVPKQGWSNPFTVLDAAAGSFGSPMLPAARVASRYGLMSEPGQRMLVNPSYGPNAADKLTPEMLKLLERYGVGGILGAGYAQK